MPLSRYSREFGGKAHGPAKALRKMQQTYGPEKGTRVFYATQKKREKQGKGRGLSRAINRRRRRTR